MNLEKSVDRSFVIQSNDNNKLVYISAITKGVSNLYNFKSPLAPLFQSGGLNTRRLGTRYTFHFYLHSPLCLAEVLAPSGCKGGLGGICFAVDFLSVTSRPGYLTFESMFTGLWFQSSDQLLFLE